MALNTGTYQDFLSALASRESSNRYDLFVAGSGFAGAYQFSEEGLQLTGHYRPDGTSAIDWNGGWTGKDGINNLSDWLESPEVQDKAIGEAFDLMWHIALKDLGLQQYVGQTINGIRITESSLLAGAHLVGPWGLADYLHSGGTNEKADGFGTPVSEYLALFSGYDVTPVIEGHGRVTPTVAGQPTIIGVGPDELTLKISQDAYQGDALYTITVDGQQIGGRLAAHALHAAGESDTVIVRGDWAGGDHQVDLTFLNDTAGATGDRNLFLDQVTYNGSAVPNGQAALWTAGEFAFDFHDNGTRPVEETLPPPPPPVDLPPTDGSLGRYYLVDADTHAKITEVKNGDQISSSLIGNRNVTLVAETDDGSVQSVKMAFDGAPTRIENIEPYALFGDTNGDLQGGLELDGQNTGQFAFYSADGARGTLLGTESLSFSVVNTSSDIWL